MKTNTLGVAGMFLLPLAMTACMKDDPSSSKTPTTTFEYIETAIFQKKCVSCHSAGEDAAKESGLLLSGKSIYANLVGVETKNEKSNAEGYKRILPGHPEKSFLLKKVMMALDPDSAHAMDGSAHVHNDNYGEGMPLGESPLSNGHIEFIRQWIIAGAPESGNVADLDLLKDLIPGKVPEFTPLKLPAAGTGFQISVEKFPIPPKFEREFFLYKGLGNPEEIFVDRFSIKMRKGSHHFILYLYKTDTPQGLAAVPEKDVFRELRNLDGSLNPKNVNALSNNAYVAVGTQISEDSLALPAGVAIRIPAQAYFDFNSHYINGSDSVAYGEVAANLYTIPKSEVKHEAMPINMGNNSFTLPPKQETVVTTDFPIGAYMDKYGSKEPDFHVVTLFSHTHQLGKKFVVKVKGGKYDGDTLYANDDWHHPPYKVFSTPLVLSRKDTLTSVTTYDNDTDKQVSFGFQSVDEMDIIFGYWY